MENEELEKVYNIAGRYNKFITKFQRLIEEGNEIAEDLKSIGIKRESDQFKLYLLNRMQNFLDRNEVFEFESIHEELNIIIGEDENEMSSM